MKFWQAFSLKRMHIENSDSYLETNKFIKNFDYSGIAEKEAEMILAHAKQTYEYVVSSVEYIDNKADVLLRYFGLGTAGVGGLVGYMLQFKNQWLSLLIILGAIFWVGAILHAIFIKKPSDFPYPADTTTIINIIKEGKDVIMSTVALALGYEIAGTALREIEYRKGMRLRMAYIYMVIALGLFLFPFLLHFILGNRFRLF